MECEQQLGSRCAGWMLRYIGNGDRKVLFHFCDEHLSHFTPEGLQYALRAQPAEVRRRYANRWKQLNACAAAEEQPTNRLKRLNACAAAEGPPTNKRDRSTATATTAAAAAGSKQKLEDAADAGTKRRRSLRKRQQI
jgi:hypothetical protein